MNNNKKQKIEAKKLSGVMLSFLMKSGGICAYEKQQEAEKLSDVSQRAVDSTKNTPSSENGVNNIDLQSLLNKNNIDNNNHNASISVDNTTAIDEVNEEVLPVIADQIIPRNPKGQIDFLLNSVMEQHFEFSPLINIFFFFINNITLFLIISLIFFVLIYYLLYDKTK